MRLLLAILLTGCSSAGLAEPATPRDRPPDLEPDNRPALRRSADGRCEPMPRVGDPCTVADSYCVISWGTPGGSSSAFWCRSRRWEIEEERNLDE